MFFVPGTTNERLCFALFLACDTPGLQANHTLKEENCSYRLLWYCFCVPFVFALLCFASGSCCLFRDLLFFVFILVFCLFLPPPRQPENYHGGCGVRLGERGISRASGGLVREGESTGRSPRTGARADATGRRRFARRCCRRNSRRHGRVGSGRPGTVRGEMYSSCAWTVVL